MRTRRKSIFQIREQIGGSKAAVSVGHRSPVQTANTIKSHPAWAETFRIEVNQSAIALGKGQVRAYTRGLTRQERMKW